MGALDTDKPIPDLVYYRPDGSLLSRIEMEKQTRDIWQKVHWLRIKANKLYDLGKPIAWDMTEVVLRHWILDEMIRRGQVVGNQLGVNVQSYNDEAEKRNFTQRLTALIQAGEALVPQEGEGFDMTNFQQPPPPPMPPGSGGPNGSQPQAPGFTPPPPPPQMGMPTMMPPPPPTGGYPPGPPQNYQPPGVGVPPGNYQQAPQPAAQPQFQQPAPGYPPVPQQFAQAPQFQNPQGQPPPPQQPQFQAPPQQPQQGTIPGAPQMGPAPTGGRGGRRGRGAASADTQTAGSVPPPPPQQAAPVPSMPGYPPQQQQFAPLPPPPQQQQPPQFQAPQNLQGGGELQALSQKVDQLLGMVAQQGQHIAFLVRKIELISAVTTVSARAVWQRDGSSDAETFLKEVGRLPQ